MSLIYEHLLFLANAAALHVIYGRTQDAKQQRLCEFLQWAIPRIKPARRATRYPVPVAHFGRSNHLFVCSKSFQVEMHFSRVVPRAKHRISLTKGPECGAGIKSMGKFLFIGREAGANQTPVSKRKTEFLHFLLGFLRGPTLFGHAV